MLSVLVMLGLMVQSASTWAAAGVVTDVHCCCPSPDVCKCHDKQSHDDDATMKRCAGGEHQLLPELAVTTLVEPPVPIDVVPAAIVVEHRVLELSPISAPAPDKPPF